MFDECLYFNTSALARRLEQEWSTAFEAFGLTPSQAFMLRVVLEKPGMLQSAISDALSIARSTATRALDALESKGYIARMKTKDDGREVSISPTSKAKVIKAQLNEASGLVTAKLKKTLGSSQFTEAVSRIRGVHAALN